MIPSPLYAEDFAFFYDGIHGGASFRDLPDAFIAPLRAALNSKYLNRLTRISQLGYTSLTFFSATQTRFSHAVGTLVLMNRLHSHLWRQPKNTKIPPDILNAVQSAFPNSLGVGGNPEISIRCHLLLAALFQDVGELPFQKVTSHYLRPNSNILKTLEATSSISDANPRAWKTKDVFTISALRELVNDNVNTSEFHGFDLAFLTYLITGQPASADIHLQGLRHMVDGVVDADRLDYVYRDAFLTIGELTNAEAVIRSIVRYEGTKVVVNDPRPVTDFLATRARLLSFVYSSPAVRFRHALLRSFLQAAFASSAGESLLAKHGLPRELTLEDFARLDDHSMLRAIREMEDGQGKTQLAQIDEWGRNARLILMKPISDYESRILAKPDEQAARNENTPSSSRKEVLIPPEVFFDLQLDAEEMYKLYTPESVLVDQALTAKMSGHPLTLEKCSGPLSSMFLLKAGVPLVVDSFLLFLPEAARRNPTSFQSLEVAMSENGPDLYRAVALEDTRREIGVLHDTWNDPALSKRTKIAISCCFKDRVDIVRIIRELHHIGARYRVLMDSSVGLGNTSDENSKKLIEQADAVFVVLSRNYVRALNAGGNIGTEVYAIGAKSSNQKVMIPLHPYEDMKQMLEQKWKPFSDSWANPPILMGQPTRGSVDNLRKFLVDACRSVGDEL